MTEPIVFERIATGDLLPPLAIPVTTSAIVAGALASSDFEVVHHDRTAAQLRGTPDVFLNILTTNGYVQRFVNGWTGRGGAIRSVELRLGVPSYPGDTLKLTGTVRGIQQVGAEQIVEVAVRGANSLGEHVAALVRVALP